MQQLGLLDLHPTPTILELDDRSRIKPEEVLDDEVVCVDSWEYLVDLLVLCLSSTSEGYPVILGRPSLTIVVAFIGCMFRNMFISSDDSVKKVNVFLPAKFVTKFQNLLWFSN